MENRLAKFGKTEEFNRQFQVNIDMGVFQKLAKKEMDTLETHELHYHGGGVQEWSIRQNTPQDKHEQAV
jgi:hypothetical protein